MIHLDRLYWQDNWKHLSREEFDKRLQSELEKESWIIDGNFNRTISHRIKYCDTIFFLDFPVWVCLCGITDRILKNYGKSRSDMGGQCIERFDANKISLYRNVLRFNKEHREVYYKLLENAEGVNVIIFRNRKQVKEYLES